MKEFKALMIRARRRAGDRAASLVEYALLVALIAVVCIGAVTQLGSAASDKTEEAGNGIGGAEAAAEEFAQDGCPEGQHRGMESHVRAGDSWHELASFCYSNSEIYSGTEHAVRAPVP